MSFETAYEATIRREGGYVLHQVKGDRGGMTYAGIARAAHADWIGWNDIDRGDTPATALVRNFYRVQFWDAIKGDSLAEPMAEALFDAAVNMGVKTALKLAQIVVGASPDGVLGKRTMVALQGIESETFRMRFALARIARYTEIGKDNQLRFLRGWIRRALEVA